MAANPNFDAVQAGAGSLDLEIESQDEEKIVFKGEWGHATVFADGRVESQVPPYVAGLQALISGQEPPVKAKNGKSNGNKTIMPTNGKSAVKGQMVTSNGILTPRDIIDYINPKATEQEAYLFCEFCKRKGADPMTKQVYLVVYEGQSGRNVSFIAGKEYFTEKAEAHPQFSGMRAGIIIRPKDGGPLEYREGEFWMSDEESLLGGWAEIVRKDRSVPFKAAIPRSEYDTKKNQWASKPGTMCRKVAIVHGLREAFPASLGGMYDSSEMNQACIADIDPEKEVSA
ncbi:MAG: phage recombination protein Bet [Candidatus Omnitrophica bacterium]|nr:phage recombination protein Bet [Candidatus Omnitrophota bacterium]